MRRLWEVHLVLAVASIAALACTSSTTGSAPSESLRAAGLQFTGISAGFVHTCALDNAGAAWCWGNNDYAQLGAESSDTCGGRPCSSDPLPVQGGLKFVAIASGWVANCGIALDERTWCWGGGADEKRGYLGDGTLQRTAKPTLVFSDSAFVDVAIGDGHFCALTRSGMAFCWGDNDWGQLGDGTRADRPVPVAVSTTLRFRTLAAGAYHTCGITHDDSAYCWGDNRWGQLGAGDVGYNEVSAAHTTPIAVSGGTNYRAIAAGWEHTCAVGEDAVTRCWGRNERARQLGDESSVTHRGVPGPIASNIEFVDLAAGALSTCGRAADGETYCWGGNYYGTLGDGNSSIGVGRPVRAQAGPFVNVAIGQSHACALNASRELNCWGDRSAGQY